MKEKKLTDEEIVKALEMNCLCVVYGKENCESCLLFEKDCRILPNAVVDLIHRLKAEKAELLKENEELTISYHGVQNQAAKRIVELTTHVEYQKAEIERLTERLDYFQKSSDYHEGNQKELEERNAELQKQADELKANNAKLEHYNKLSQGIYYGNGEQFCDRLQQAVKDTAKEIYKEIGKDDILVVETQEYGEIEVVPLERLQEIIKSKGVEVEQC